MSSITIQRTQRKYYAIWDFGHVTTFQIFMHIKTALISSAESNSMTNLWLVVLS